MRPTSHHIRALIHCVTVTIFHTECVFIQIHTVDGELKKKKSQSAQGKNLHTIYKEVKQIEILLILVNKLIRMCSPIDSNHFVIHWRGRFGRVRHIFLFSSSLSQLLYIYEYECVCRVCLIYLVSLTIQYRFFFYIIFTFV